MNNSEHRLLKAYSGILTIAFAALILSGARAPKKGEFDELTVRRINVVEPDGTLRLTISGSARFPGTPVKGREIPRPDRTHMAGMIYMDDEGTEIGGFAWGGKTVDGKTKAFGHLSFDRYQGDENISLGTEERDGKLYTGMEIRDSYSGLEANLEPERIRALPRDRQDAAWAAWKKKHPSTQRLALGRDKDGSVVHAMKDLQGRLRILMMVAADGEPSIELLDAAGKVTARIPEKRP